MPSGVEEMRVRYAATDVAGSLDGTGLHLYDHDTDYAAFYQCSTPSQRNRPVFYDNTVASNVESYKPLDRPVLEGPANDCRSHEFTFCLPRNRIALLQECEIWGGEEVCALFVTEFNPVLGRCEGRMKLCAQAIHGQVVAASQDGENIYVLNRIPRAMNTVRLSCLDTRRFSKHSVKLSLNPIMLIDILCDSGTIYFIQKRKAEGRYVVDTRTLTVLSFPSTEMRELKLKGTASDGEYPPDLRSIHTGFDMALGAIWFYAAPSRWHSLEDESSEDESEDGEAMNQRNSFWRLDLTSLTWSRINLALPRPVSGPMFHTLPWGRAFLASKDKVVYSFWLEDVPSLSALAFAAVCKSFPNLSRLPVSELREIGFPQHMIKWL